jgi:hypothetical protein
MAKRATQTTAKNRADEVRTERRKKPGQMAYGGGRLAVDESMLDRNTYEYRWVSDAPGRVQRLHDEDWDRVNDPAIKPDANTKGTVLSVHGGTEASGKNVDQILMRKRKEWFDEDQKEKLRPMEEVDKQLRSGQADVIAADTDADLANHAYVPGGGNSMKSIRGAKAS